MQGVTAMDDFYMTLVLDLLCNFTFYIFVPCMAFTVVANFFRERRRRR